MDPTLIANAIAQEIVTGVLGLLFCGPLILFLWVRGTALLMFFQQEEYDSGRFIRWWWLAKAFDRWASVLISGAFLVPLLALPYMDGAQATPLFFAVPALFWFVAPTVGVYRSRINLEKAKKPLVMTARAKRIFAVYLILWAFVGAALFIVSVSLILISLLGSGHIALIAALALVFVILYQLPPFLLVLANWLLTPFEKITQRKYWREAKEKLDELDPYIIAITGSYGKTSTKHILNHILSSTEQVLATPGSVNTEMGIARIVRERLKPQHKYFIVEMGAYGPGSIARLCKLAPPKMGLITAIGHAHYERFKSLETVADAKFELAEAVYANTPKKGRTIINVNAMPDGVLEAQRDRSGRLVLAGRAGAGDVDRPYTLGIVMKDSLETAEGLMLTLTIMGGFGAKDVSFMVPIWGQHQADNVMMAVATALELGYPVETIQAALRTCPQVRHRQEVTLSDVGPNVIDDAYNSNPTGFASALDTLAVLGEVRGHGIGQSGAPGNGRRVLITPGMVELGAAHDEKHLELGRKAGECVDLALIVGPERIPTFMEGLRGTAATRDDDATVIKTFARQQDAEDWYKANTQPLDVVLFENNLPDLYEAKVRF